MTTIHNIFAIIKEKKSKVLNRGGGSVLCGSWIIVAKRLLDEI